MSKINFFCYDCDKKFKIQELRTIEETIVCPDCGAKHLLGEDYNDDDSLFWYVAKVQSGESS